MVSDYFFVFVKVFGIIYSWFNNNIVESVITFIKVFGNAVILVGAVIFLIILVYITIKNLKKLPKQYTIVTMDVYGNGVVLEGIRTKFSTYAAAKHYSDFYQGLFKQQYKFSVIGNKWMILHLNQFF